MMNKETGSSRSCCKTQLASSKGEHSKAGNCWETGKMHKMSTSSYFMTLFLLVLNELRCCGACILIQQLAESNWEVINFIKCKKILDCLMHHLWLLFTESDSVLFCHVIEVNDMVLTSKLSVIDSCLATRSLEPLEGTGAAKSRCLSERHKYICPAGWCVSASDTLGINCFKLSFLH